MDLIYRFSRVSTLLARISASAIFVAFFIPLYFGHPYLSGSVPLLTAAVGWVGWLLIRRLQGKRERHEDDWFIGFALAGVAAYGAVAFSYLKEIEYGALFGAVLLIASLTSVFLFGRDPLFPGSNRFVPNPLKLLAMGGVAFMVALALSFSVKVQPAGTYRFDAVSGKRMEGLFAFAPAFPSRSDEVVSAFPRFLVSVHFTAGPDRDFGTGWIPTGYKMSDLAEVTVTPSDFRTYVRLINYDFDKDVPTLGSRKDPKPLVSRSDGPEEVRKWVLGHIGANETEATVSVELEWQ